MYRRYPRGLKGRVTEKRRQKLLDEAHRTYVASAHREKTEHANAEATTPEAQKAHEERVAKVGLLAKLEKSFEDPGPYLDVVSYQVASAHFLLLTSTWGATW